jgi:hypothetical protein
LEKNLSQYPLLATKPTWTGHGFEPRPVQWETSGHWLEPCYDWASVIFVIIACFVFFTFLISAHLQAWERNGLTFHIFWPVSDLRPLTW